MTAVENDTFHIGFALSGAVSAGAYTAGVLDFFFQALNEWEKARGVAGTPEHRVDVQVVTGASAGAISGALGVVALARGIRPQKLSATEKQNTHPIESADGLEAFRRSRIRALCEIAHGRPDHANLIVRNMTPAADLPLQEAQLLELQGELAAAQYDARAAASLL